MPSVRKTRRHAEDAYLASMVIAMRMPVMMLEAMSKTERSGAETQRAVSEKVAAAVDGAVAAQVSLISSASTFWFDVMCGQSPAGLMAKAARKAADASVRPGRKTLRANYKRLQRSA